MTNAKLWHWQLVSWGHNEDQVAIGCIGVTMIPFVCSFVGHSFHTMSISVQCSTLCMLLSVDYFYPRALFSLHLFAIP